MSYKPNYSGGWKSGEAGGTPITPEALNHMEDGIEQANENVLPAPQAADNATFLRNDNTWSKVTPANIGAAPSTHRHSASDISEGELSVGRLPVVPVTKGGTGAANELDARKNLGIEGLQTKIITNSSSKGLLQTLKDEYSSLSDYQLYIIRVADNGAQRIAIGMKYGNYGQFIGISIEGFRYYNNYNGTWSERVIS